KGVEDPISEVAARTARRFRLICFDEFHVSDIADAMILGRFLEKAMDKGVEFVMTSNYPPDGLYPNGLQRERFLPAIELLKRRRAGVVRFRDAVRRPALVRRLRRSGKALPYGYPLGCSAPRTEAGRRRAALHLAGGCVLR